MLARPLFREKHSPDMSEAEATELVHEALKVCESLYHIDMPLHGSSDKDTPRGKFSLNQGTASACVI